MTIVVQEQEWDADRKQVHLQTFGHSTHSLRAKVVSVLIVVVVVAVFGQTCFVEASHEAVASRDLNMENKKHNEGLHIRH